MWRPLTTLALAASLACAPAADPDRERDFTDAFWFGATVSGFQVEAGCPRVPADVCEDRRSDWYQWVTDPELVDQPGNYVSGDPMTAGPGHWELYRGDVDLAANTVGLDALRMSLEWSRLFPNEPVGARTVDELAVWADPEAVEAYHDRLDALVAAGVNPVVTLQHGTLPRWLHDPAPCHADLATCRDAGWADPERMVPEIARYAGFVAREFGADVDVWVTLDDPVGGALSGYLHPGGDRTSPPGVMDPSAAVAALWAQIDAHAAMTQAIRVEDPGSRVGLSLEMLAVQPDDPQRAEDIVAAEHIAYLYDRVVPNALLLGEVDRDLDGVAEALDPTLAGTLDFVGVAYRSRVAGRAAAVAAGAPKVLDFLPVDGLRWEDPDGLAEVLALVDGYGAPALITGLGTDDPTGAGARFVEPHLQVVRRALDDGIDVQGVFAWSLLDGYAWNHGVGPQMGLLEVDPTTKTRRLSDQGEAWRAVARTGQLPADRGDQAPR